MTNDFRAFIIWFLIIWFWIFAIILFVPSLGWSVKLAGGIGEFCGDRYWIDYSHGHPYDYGGM